MSRQKSKRKNIDYLMNDIAVQVLREPDIILGDFIDNHKKGYTKEQSDQYEESLHDALQDALKNINRIMDKNISCLTLKIKKNRNVYDDEYQDEIDNRKFHKNGIVDYKTKSKKQTKAKVQKVKTVKPKVKKTKK